jgi:hypothetical protein
VSSYRNSLKKENYRAFFKEGGVGVGVGVGVCGHSGPVVCVRFVSRRLWRLCYLISYTQKERVGVRMWIMQTTKKKIKI